MLHISVRLFPGKTYPCTSAPKLIVGVGTWKIGRGRGDGGTAQAQVWARLALRRTWMLDASRVGLFGLEAVQNIPCRG